MTSARPSLFPLTDLFKDSNRPLERLIIDLSIRNKPLPDIRQNYRDGKYAPASDKDIVGYIEMARGKQ